MASLLECERGYQELVTTLERLYADVARMRAALDKPATPQTTPPELSRRGNTSQRLQRCRAESARLDVLVREARAESAILWTDLVPRRLE